MTAVSSKEFASHQKKYYDMAVNEDVFIKRGNSTFRLVYDGGHDEVLTPDDDFRRAITGEELLERICEDIDRKFASRL